MVTFDKVSTGKFKVLNNNVATEYEIINGCLGSSGKGNNLYGISNNKTNKINWLGSLQKCKKTLTHHFSK